MSAEFDLFLNNSELDHENWLSSLRIAWDAGGASKDARIEELQKLIGRLRSELEECECCDDFEEEATKVGLEAFEDIVIEDIRITGWSDDPLAMGLGITDGTAVHHIPSGRLFTCNKHDSILDNENDALSQLDKYLKGGM